MTAKEKALELVEKFYSKITGMDLIYISRFIELPTGDNYFKTAKQCALIAVDEVYDNIVKSSPRGKYWEQVKQEIEYI